MIFGSIDAAVDKLMPKLPEGHTNAIMVGTHNGAIQAAARVNLIDDHASVKVAFGRDKSGALDYEAQVLASW